MTTTIPIPVHDRLYIGGKWVQATADETIDVVNPYTEEVIASIPAGTAADVDRAVAAARTAFPGWAATSIERRAALLDAVAERLSARGEELAAIITSELGAPVGLARLIQVGLPTMTFASMRGLLDEYAFEENIGNSLVTREPVGVVAAITPWNYPLHQIAAKVAPALASGCTVVLKPSEVAPLNAFILAEIIHESGLPAGVFNLVTGTGQTVGEALVRHSGVDMVSFTGSTSAGRRISEVAAHTVKRVALELGGKSASVVLEDADLAQAVKHTLSVCFLNSGQTCNALTRLLVPASRYDEAAKLAVDGAQTFTVGDPLTSDARLGPLVSARTARTGADLYPQGNRGRRAASHRRSERRRAWIRATTSDPRCSAGLNLR